jgi:alpha-L-rhamnosidase
MGQNMVGWCRLRVSGPRGSTVTLRHAETLKPDGTLYVANLRSARAEDRYTLKGSGVESWEPRFIFHGFRYVEVTGFPGVPEIESIDGRVVHDDMHRLADFETSSALLNRLHENILWGVRGNYRSIPTDCPQRDERMGWLGDRSVVSRSESYLHDVAAFYNKWVTDIEDAQRPTGSIPDVAPAYWVLYNDGITWPSTFVLASTMLHDQYADRRVIERHYPAMKKWIGYMRGFIKDDLMPRNTYGDWCVPPESPTLIHSKDPARQTDGTLISTAYYLEMLRLMSRYARMTGNDADAADYQALAGRMKEAFLRKFFKPARNVFDNGTQTSSVLPLAFGIVPQDRRKPVFDALVAKIEKESDNHVGVGLIGAQWLMRTLSENGRADLAYTIATQKTYPGWGYMIGKGATTIWELWNGDTADPAMNSGNHVMQIGDLNVWFYEYLAGIRTDPEHPGFRKIVIRPYPAGDLTYVRASHESMHGRIASHWRKTGGRFELDVTIPPNTTATVFVPAPSATRVRAPGGKFLRMEDGAAVFAVDSGSYRFAVN